jgi:hypothetical protein
MSDKKEHLALLTELSTALSEKTRMAIASRIALRDAVCAYVAAETTNGVSLENLIQTVKKILRRAEKGAANTSDELAQQLVDWCVEFHRSAGAVVPGPVGLLS